MAVPEKVMKAFAESDVAEIFAKDEIPYKEGGTVVLDGMEYDIEIAIDGATKNYHACEEQMKAYPLLRKLADWYRDL